MQRAGPRSPSGLFLCGDWLVFSLLPSLSRTVLLLDFFSLEVNSCDRWWVWETGGGQEMREECFCQCEFIQIC